MYRKQSEEVLQLLQSDARLGLTDEQVLSQREKFGLNELEEKKREPWIVKFLKQFADVLIIILLVAAVISLIVDPSEWVDSLVIFIVVMLNAVLGVVQESKAEKSLDALKKMSSPTCKVIREREDGRHSLCRTGGRGCHSGGSGGLYSRRRAPDRRSKPPGRRIRPDGRVAPGQQAYRNAGRGDNRLGRP